MAEGRNRGIVKWFNGSKGYGFIAVDGQKEDIFVHWSAIAMEGYKKLNEGDVVEFNIGRGQKGLQAENVVLIEAGNPEPRREPHKTKRDPTG